MKNYNNEGNPEFLNNYLVHLKVVQLHSERTIQEYYLDIRLFLKFFLSGKSGTAEDIEDISISGMTEQELRDITVTDIYNFIFYASDERNNADKARYRKI